MFTIPVDFCMLFSPPKQQNFLISEKLYRQREKIDDDYVEGFCYDES